MNLQHVDVSAQTLDTRINRIKDVLAGQANTVDKVPIIAGCRGDGWEFALVIHAEEALGQDDYAVARDVVLFQGFANYLLGSAMGIDISLFKALG